ncbi:MAG: hypothetical protein WCR42_00700 [bacterium]
MITKTKIVLFFVITILLSYSSMKKDKEVPSERALSVKCNVTKINDKTLHFEVVATRLRLDSLEHFRSSEHLKLIISDKRGTVIWRSDSKYAFSSSISKPLPDSVGQTHKYFIDWYVTDNSNNILVTGKYKAQVLITSLPKPYVMDMEIDWKNPYDK